MITFDEATHTYLNDGKRVLSVTQILREAGLITGTDFFTEDARLRGEAVHKACEYLDEDDLDFETVDPAYLPYLKAYQKFLSDFNPSWKDIEKIVYNNTYNYVGTFDRAGILLNDLCVLDIKSGGKLPWHPVQLAAYAGAYTTSAIKRYGLYLKDDGDYKLKEYSDPKDFRIFTCAAAVANWKLLKGIIK